MKTFEQYWQTQDAPIFKNGGYKPQEEIAKEAWNACASEHAHLLANKETAINLHKEAFELTKKKNEELEGRIKELTKLVWEDQPDMKKMLEDLDWATTMIGHMVFSEDKEKRMEIRERHKLDQAKA